MLLYPAVCEPVAYTTYLLFCDSEHNWMDECRAATWPSGWLGLVTPVSVDTEKTGNRSTAFNSIGK